MHVCVVFFPTKACSAALSLSRADVGPGPPMRLDTPVHFSPASLSTPSPSPRGTAPLTWNTCACATHNCRAAWQQAAWSCCAAHTCACTCFRTPRRTFKSSLFLSLRRTASPQLGRSCTFRLPAGILDVSPVITTEVGLQARHFKHQAPENLRRRRLGGLLPLRCCCASSGHQAKSCMLRRPQCPVLLMHAGQSLPRRPRNSGY